MPPLLTGRNLPQTLLLTALFLLIVVAPTMLACGPVAQPAPAADGALPAAQQSDGGDEPTEEPTDTPTDTPTAAPAGATDTPTPELEEVADTPTPAPRNTDTPTPEADEATATPTPEAEEPTATPTPEPAEPAPTPTPEPAEPTVAPTPEPAEPTQTPLPTICLQQADGEICFEKPQPTPTPKYPVLGEFSRYAQEAEEAQADASQSEVKVTKVFVRISLSSGASGEPMLAWLQSNGVPLTTNWPYGIENNLVAIYGYGFEPDSPDGYIYAIVPASLLLPLSQRPGFAGIEDACRRGGCEPAYP